jgi:thioredoxin 1
MIQYLDKSNFDTTINTNDVVLVDFFADWCGPCKALHPALEELAKEFDGKVVISKLM